MSKPRGFEPYMSKRQHKQFSDAIRELADAMGLATWSFTLTTDAETENEDAMATVQVIANRQHANIRLMPEWLLLDPRDQLISLVHELVHCHSDPFMFLLRNILAELLGSNECLIFDQLLTSGNETMVDNIAVAWMRQFPLKGFAKATNGKKQK